MVRFMVISIPRLEKLRFRVVKLCIGPALMLLFFGNRTEMTDGMLSFIKKSFGF